MNTPIRFALVGNPNCGKTSLFNRLTGARAKVANYPGVTVERRAGEIAGLGRRAELVDLPGTYSLHVTSPTNRSPAISSSASLSAKLCRMCWSPWSMPPTCGSACGWYWN